ncbi:MAG: dockerin type I domain-containing protein, partial [Planctomycetota bacterium]
TSDVLPAQRQLTRYGSVGMLIPPSTSRGVCLSVEHAGLENVVQSTDGVDERPNVFDCDVCVPLRTPPRFLCGGPELGVDFLPIQAKEVPRGETSELCFWYTLNAEDFLPNGDIQALSMAIEHDCSLLCEESSFRIPPDSVTAQIEAEFVTFACESDPRDGDGCEMVFSVLVDLVPPVENPVLPATSLPLKLGCVDVGISTMATLGFDLPIRFENGVAGRGTVPVSNVVSIDNLPVIPETIDCSIGVEFLGPEFFCGSCVAGSDGLPLTPTAKPGEPAELCFWYSAPNGNQVQGISIAVEHDCRLTCVDGSIRLPEDSIAEAIGVEFIDLSCDSDPRDGDGCEMLIGLLVDASPPFDGRTLPPTVDPYLLVSVDMILPENAECGSCYNVRFVDRLNGTGRVPIDNLVSVENFPFLAKTTDCRVCARTEADQSFLRGDCQLDDDVNISDAAMVISSLFAPAVFRPTPRCEDACDANDDGRIDLADAHAILYYLFVPGTPPLPLPGAIDVGPDPTEDPLGCGRVIDPCPLNFDD